MARTCLQEDIGEGEIIIRYRKDNHIGLEASIFMWLQEGHELVAGDELCFTIEALDTEHGGVVGMRAEVDDTTLVFVKGSKEVSREVIELVVDDLLRLVND